MAISQNHFENACLALETTHQRLDIAGRWDDAKVVRNVRIRSFTFNSVSLTTDTVRFKTPTHYKKSQRFADQSSAHERV